MLSSDTNSNDSNSIIVNVMLTTLDNPFNPFTQWNEWFQFDVSKGYNTCGYLARIAYSSDDLSELDDSLAIQRAIDEILRFNLTGNYIKVTRETWKNRTI